MQQVKMAMLKFVLLLLLSAYALGSPYWRTETRKKIEENNGAECCAWDAPYQQQVNDESYQQQVNDEPKQEKRLKLFDIDDIYRFENNDEECCAWDEPRHEDKNEHGY